VSGEEGRGHYLPIVEKKVLIVLYCITYNQIEIFILFLLLYFSRAYRNWEGEGD
jgi:hypothetical protein